MTASPYASVAKIDEALAAIEAEYVGTRKQTILEQIFVACAMGSSPPPPAPPVPQNLRLASVQNPDSITVEWDALPSSPDYDVEVYTPDDVWVSLGGTMGGITREYGTSDGMVYGSTYSFRVRSTFDFVTFSDWSAPLYGVVAPPPSLYYINQGSGLWYDADNWFDDQSGTIPHGATPSVSDYCVINLGNTVDQVPGNTSASVTNYGTVSTNYSIIINNYGTIVSNQNSNSTVTNNFGTITINDSGAIVNSNVGTVTTNSFNGIVNTNNGTITTNNGTVGANVNGTIATNNGTVTTNDSGGTITYNYGSVATNNGGGLITINYGGVNTNSGSTTSNYGIIDSNYGTVEINNSGYYVYTNYGTVIQNCGTIVNDYGTSGPCLV
jgi:hypothetical protein